MIKRNVIVCFSSSRIVCHSCRSIIIVVEVAYRIDEREREELANLREKIRNAKERR